MTIKAVNNLSLALCCSAVVFLVISTCHHSFFWDTVQLGSAHANFYFNNHFSKLLLPTDIDSGHIPFFGAYIAMLWTLFDRSLEVSHLGILPFALGIVWQLFKLCEKFIPSPYVGCALILVLADPSLLSQMTLVSPDVCLIFFFLLGMNAVFDNRRLWLSIAILGLFLTSMRGMMVSLCLLGLDVYLHINFKTTVRNLFIQMAVRSLIYLPALTVFLLYNTLHYQATGWIGYHQDSPWAESFQRVDDFKGFLFNVGLYAWRVLDMGRIGIWLVLFIVIAFHKKGILREKNSSILLLFTMALMLLLPLNMLWAKNLMGYRYLIPIYLCVALCTAVLLFSESIPKKLQYALSLFWFVSLIGGHFIIYPDKIAKGWDSTLAHLPYYELRKDAIGYLDEKNIDFSEVQSFFPNTATIDRIDLNHDFRRFTNYDGTGNYVIYSNIFNIDDLTYDTITNPQHYQVVKQFESHGVFFRILKKR